MSAIHIQRRLPLLQSHERETLEQRAKLLAWGGNARHAVEFAVAGVAGWEGIDSRRGRSRECC